MPHNPPYCIEYQDRDVVEGFSIPCGRGNAFYNSIMFLIIVIALVCPPPISIVTTMVMMYRTVLKIERKVARCGVNALHLRTNQQERGERGENTLNSNEDITPAPSIIEKIQNCISCWLSSLWYLLICRNYNHTGCDANDDSVARYAEGMVSSPARGSNTLKRAASRKRAILQIASGYVAAWVLV